MLKIMTMNLNYYVTKHGEWTVRRQIIEETLREHRPDILALQAVRQDPALEDNTNQAEQLSRFLQYEHVVFQPAQEQANGVLEGSAVVSRLPFAECQHLDLTTLPGLDDTAQRTLLHTRFDLEDGPLHLFNAHFSWVGEQMEKNLDQALPYMRRAEGKALMVGDLNTPSDSTRLGRIRQDGWTDIWAENFPDMPGYTFESSDPSLRIDYAWANQTLKPLVQGITIVADQPHITGERASDHFGLLVTLHL